MKRKRITALVLCVVIFAALFCGCAKKTAGEPEAVESMEPEIKSVVDMSGKEVEIPSVIDNYCILYSSATPVLAMLDENFAHVKMIPNGYEDWLHLFFPNLAEQAQIINKRTITAEEIVENGTQLVFCADNTNADVIEALEKTGIPCVNLTVRNTDEMLKAVQLVAEIFDTEYAHEKADAYCTYFADTVEKCKTLADNIPDDQRIRLLTLGNYDALTGSGVNTWIYSWATAIHVDYIVPSEDGADKVDLTMEQIYEYDPDAILFAGYKNCLEEAYASPEWQTLPAAKEHQLYQSPICFDVWAMPNTQCVLLYEWGLVTFYADYANGINLKQDTIDFYKQFYGYELTSDEADAVIAGNRIYME